MSIAPKAFYEAFIENDVSFFVGVPDSLLKSFCAYLQDHDDNGHVIAANEGGAIAMAMGNYLAKGVPSLVYLQNSGLGNVVNPLISMADPDVYAIPMVLVVGWRGEIGNDDKQIKDEPQHKKQGRITLALLEAMGIYYEVIDSETVDIKILVSRLVKRAMETQSPVCIVVRKGTFSPYFLQKTNRNVALSKLLSRERFIEIFAKFLHRNEFVVSTTGMISRELFELREKHDMGHSQDFLVVGAMGHTSQIASGVLHADSKKVVYCLDGDGSLLMHMGGLSINKNYPIKHIVINNGVHDSVGGQPTAAMDIDVASMAKNASYTWVYRASTEAEMSQGLVGLREAKGPSLLEVFVRPGSRKDLGRPTWTSTQIKERFMESLRSSGDN